MDSNKKEKLRLFWIIVWSQIIGILIGYYFQSLLFFLSFYIIWLLSKLFDLNNWLAAGTKIEKAPFGSGAWGRVVSHIVKLKNQQINTKKQYKKLVVRLNEILRSFPYPTIIVNSNNEMQWISAGSSKILGLNRKKDIGLRINNIIRLNKFSEILASPKYNEFEMQSPTDKNTILTLAISKLNKDSRVISIHNISDKVRLNELRNTFIANASHELRTPLTVVSCYLETLNQNHKLDKETKLMISNAYESTKHMSSLVSSLLELSGLEDGYSNSINHKTIDINNITHKAIENIKKSIDIEQDIKIKINKDITILANKSHIYIAIFNLIENAIKYSNKKGIINICWSVKEDKACFEVIDRSKGIDESIINNLTEPFYRINTNSHIKGHGLGLSIVAKAIKKNDGKLIIKSTTNQGSIFSLVFKNYINKASTKL